MGSVVGSIELTDRASSVLKNIRNEQTAFRKDVAETGKELERTWGKTYKAKLDTGTATGKATALIGKLKQVGKTAATPVIKAKDSATGVVNKVSSRIKSVGKAVASPFIRVKDVASKPISKIAGGLKAVGKVFTPIVRLKDAASKGISAIGGKLKGLATKVVIPVAVAASAATTAVVGGAISQGAQLEQSIGGVETLFKGDAGVVKANADAAFRTAGLSANEYMEQVTSFSASLLSSLGGDTAKAASVADMAMVDMADNANKFGTDIGSIQNAYQGFAKQNYTMLDNLKLGYGGTKEEMQRLLADAGKLTGVKYDIDSLSDVYNAIHAIQENLGVTGTTAKEASETFSGSFAAMKAAGKNLLGNMAIGGDVTGSMADLVDTASTFLFSNAVPMVSRVVTALPGAIQTGLKSAGPKIKTAGAEVVKGLRDGIVKALPSSMSGIANDLFDRLGDLGGGFSAVVPQLTAFGTSMAATFQQIAGACVPLLTSIISTVQIALPAVLPVIQTVIATIGNLIAQASPVIAGLVGAIGIAVTALAPVFQTIFSEIGAKVSTVIGIVSERMGFIQSVISTVAPIIGEVLTTAWSIISPVMDILITTFELVFDVVQTVWPGIQSVIEGVWGVLEPIFSTIGKGADLLAGAWSKVKGLITGKDSGGNGGSSGGSSPGTNATGDNNWRGGLTWVGERGPELVDLPRGSRILPHKESVTWALGRRDNIIPLPVPALTGSGSDQRTSENETVSRNGRSIVVQINKIADNVTVRNDSDVDEIAERTAKKIIEELDNTA